MASPNAASPKSDYVDLWQIHNVQSRDGFENIIGQGGVLETLEAIERGVGVQAIKVFGKAFLLRSLSPTECLRYALSQPGVHVAICRAGTQGQMEDNIRTVQGFRKQLTAEEIADIRKRAAAGAGVYTGLALE